MSTERVNAEEAARILGRNRRTVNRLCNAGKISGIASSKGTVFEMSEIERYADNLRNLSNVGSTVVEAYVFEALDVFDAKDFSECVPESLQSAVNVYRQTRAGKIANYYVPADDVFMICEVTARLGIVDLHPIYRLIKESKLKSAELNGSPNGDKRRILVTKDSFSEYLGDDVGNRFFNSRYAAKEIRKTVQAVDKIALQHEIGRKINDGRKNSNYLFTLNDIDKLDNLRRMY